MRSLLDVNVLIALLDVEHLHHAAATRWFARHAAEGWATCPLTQNGCIRIVSQPSYRHQVSVHLVAKALSQATADPQHEFWSDALTLLDPEVLDWDKLLTGRQLTDVYLLALAVRNDGRLVTLDRGIPLHAVLGATAKHLVVLAHDDSPNHL